MAMAVEAKRGCGYRKVGGIYIVSDPGGFGCCSLPLELSICPCCGGGIKQARGFTWVNPGLLFQKNEPLKPGCNAVCPVANPASMGERAGLLWVGERFYPTPAAFDREAGTLGISKRVAALPRGFKVGETFVLLAHPKAVLREVEAAGELVPKLEHRPGVFRIFRPSRVEKILNQSMATEAELERLKKAGITPVIVPDDDPDHMGSVYDATDEEDDGEHFIV
jgi:hypothetical protein